MSQSSKLRVLNTGQSTVGWHRHGTMLLCPQKYAYAYVLKMKRSEAAPAPFLGTLVHQGLAHLYLHIGLSALNKRHGSWARWGQAITQHAEESDEGKLFNPTARAELVGRATQILHNYVRVYPEDAVRYEVLKVEHEIRVQVDGELYTQRADLIVRNKRDQKVYIWDHKTAGGFGLSYGAAQYTLSGQILGLGYLGEQVYGNEFGGVVLNMLSTKKPDFNRVFAGSAPDSAAKFLQYLRWARHLVKTLSRTDPRSYPRVLDPTVCHAYGGCDFKDDCRYGVNAANAESTDD